MKRINNDPGLVAFEWTLNLNTAGTILLLRFFSKNRVEIIDAWLEKSGAHLNLYRRERYKKRYITEFYITAPPIIDDNVIYRRGKKNYKIKFHLWRIYGLRINWLPIIINNGGGDGDMKQSHPDIYPHSSSEDFSEGNQVGRGIMSINGNRVINNCLTHPPDMA